MMARRDDALKSSDKGATQMPRFFQSPAGLKHEYIPYPDKLTQNDLITDEALSCVLYAQHSMKAEHGIDISLKEKISAAVLDWYDNEGQYMTDNAYKSRNAKTSKTPRRVKRKKPSKPSNVIAFPRPSKADRQWAGEMGVRL
jgi:hypothetical protein